MATTIIGIICLVFALPASYLAILQLMDRRVSQSNSGLGGSMNTQRRWWIYVVLSFALIIAGILVLVHKPEPLAPVQTAVQPPVAPLVVKPTASTAVLHPSPRPTVKKPRTDVPQAELLPTAAAQQVGTENNQHVQIMTESPGGMQAEGNLTVIGKLDPPNRVLTASGIEATKGILKTLPPSAKIRFAVIGNSAEITSFANQVIGLFPETNTLFIDRPSRDSISAINETVSHGEGISCQTPDREHPSQIAQTVKRILSASEFPCTEGPANFSPSGIVVHGKSYPVDRSDVMPDIYIAIGTRFLPEK